jgi:hypothetical protein
VLAALPLVSVHAAEIVRLGKAEEVAEYVDALVICPQDALSNVRWHLRPWRR